MAKPASPAGGPEPQTLDEILDWHTGMVDALIAQRASVQRAIREGLSVPHRFVGMMEDELDAYHDSQRRELDRLTVLNLVASVEATIRSDYSRRVRKKLKDPLSKSYRRWHRTLSTSKQLRPDFDKKGILEVVKKAAVMDNHKINRYRECLQARHWVGHGRYWDKPVWVDQLLPTDVYARCLDLLQGWPSE